MLWFLRHFSLFTKLEKDCASLEEYGKVREGIITELTKRNLDLSRDCKVYLEQRDQAIQESMKAQAEASKNLKLIANWQAVQAGAYQVPFPEVHTPIVPLVNNMEAALQQVPALRTARTTQQEMVAESRKKAMELRNKLKADADGTYSAGFSN